MLRSIRAPLLLLAVALLGGTSLLAVDSAAWIGDHSTYAPAFRSDVRIAIATMVVMMAIWIALLIVLDSLGRLERGHEATAGWLARAERRIDHLEGSQDTGRLPRLKAVGTVVVAPVEVREPAFDPKVVELGQRIARKITDS